MRCRPPTWATGIGLAMENATQVRALDELREGKSQGVYLYGCDQLCRSMSQWKDVVKTAITAAVIMVILDRLGLIGGEPWLEVSRGAAAYPSEAPPPCTGGARLPKRAPGVRTASCLPGLHELSC